MLKSVQALAEHALTGNLESCRIGNHFCARSESNYREFYYHDTCICIIDTEDKTVMFDNCGWNTSSTTRAINSYRQAFTGFHELPVEEFKEIMNRRASR